MLTDKELSTLKECWKRSPNKGWEPKGGANTPYIKKFVEAGFLKVADGRCGFEKIKDAMVTWTEAGRKAMETQE